MSQIALFMHVEVLQDLIHGQQTLDSRQTPHTAKCAFGAAVKVTWTLFWQVFIQRSSGCDHMTCVRCKTDFCYRCGERFIEIRFIGDHYSKLSILGCKYRLKPNNPAQRRFIRGAVFSEHVHHCHLIEFANINNNSSCFILFSFQMLFSRQ